MSMQGGTFASTFFDLTEVPVDGVRAVTTKPGR